MLQRYDRSVSVIPMLPWISPPAGKMLGGGPILTQSRSVVPISQPCQNWVWAVTHLKSTLSALLSESPSQQSQREFLTFCHNLALLCVRRKVKNTRNNPAFAGMSFEQLAWECIADLFERNETGAFPKLRAYFSVQAWEQQNEGELESLTRRLIFSQIQRALFRLYRESDPALGKLLRNLKLALRRSETLVLVRRHGQHWVRLKQSAAHSTAQEILPAHVLAAHFKAGLRGELRLPRALSLFAQVLREYHEHYRAEFPLTGLAVTLREAFENLHRVLAEDGNGHEGYSPGEIEGMIAANVAAIKAQRHGAYVAGRKISAETYEAYFRAIQDLLKAEFVPGGDSLCSYYDHLRTHLPNLSREQYQRQCRCHFEYFAKLSRRKLLNNFKKEW